jgi:hypothetical protein
MMSERKKIEREEWKIWSVYSMVINLMKSEALKRNYFFLTFWCDQKTDISVVIHFKFSMGKITTIIVVYDVDDDDAETEFNSVFFCSTLDDFKFFSSFFLFRLCKILSEKFKRCLCVWWLWSWQEIRVYESSSWMKIILKMSSEKWKREFWCVGNLNCF